MFSTMCRLCTVMMWVGAVAEEPSAEAREKGKVVQQMTIEAPAMTEEDHYGYNMPDQYKCDACRGVMYHLASALSAKQPKSRRLQEWEYQDIFDETCADGFKGYGVKKIDGQNVLSGPGIAHEEKLQPGMGAIQMGGDKWEKRMGEICRKLVYETIGEDTLYEQFRTTGKLSESLCLDSTQVCQQRVNGDRVAKESKKGKQKDHPKKGKSPKSKMQVMEKKRHHEEKSSIANREIDLTEFMSHLAIEDKLTSNAYTTKRSRKEWEKTLLQIAGRLYTKSASDESVTRV